MLPNVIDDNPPAPDEVAEPIAFIRVMCLDCSLVVDSRCRPPLFGGTALSEAILIARLDEQHRERGHECRNYQPQFYKEFGNGIHPPPFGRIPARHIWVYGRGLVLVHGDPQ